MKPALPEGVRDFSPEQLRKRTYIFETMKTIFTKYGFAPIETPTMEKLVTLTGKYGEEGDRLLFKILNNGDFLQKADQQAITDKNSTKLIASISERGLRYDLTVPFARYVVMHRNDIALPFKRYQIQPVWRADRPQKGRYREFYQCDCDVVGSPSLMYEAELVQIYDEVFVALGLNVTIKVNNRKILEGIAEAVGISDKFIDLTTAIDKLDKIGLNGVKTELLDRNIPELAIEKIVTILTIKDLTSLEPFFAHSEVGKKGIEELRAFHRYLDVAKPKNTVEFDLTLARGLTYYTGCIFEVVANDVQMGSIGGGGRYDNLTGMFGWDGVSGVGVSFGAERIYDVMEELRLFPADVQGSQLQVFLIAFDDPTHHFAFEQLTKLRAAGIAADLYPTPLKIQKQMEYANKRQVPYVVLIGETEMQTGIFSFKNMTTGEQQNLSLADIIKRLA